MGSNVVEIILKAKNNLKDGLTMPINDLKSMKTALGKIAPTAIAVGTAVAGTIAYLSKQQIDFADKLSDTAEKIGSTTESLSTLGYAAKMNGTDTETLITGLKKLSINAFDASKGSLEASQNFAALGVSFKNQDGTLKTSETLLKNVADKFAQMPNDANKTALAVKLFGKSGAELIPMLNQGSQGIAEMQAKARSLGLEISTSFGQNAGKLFDSIDIISKTFKEGIINVLVESVLPALVEFANFFSENMPAVIQWVRDFKDDLKQLQPAFKVVWNVVQTIWAVIKDVFEEMGLFIATIGNVIYNVMTGNFKQAFVGIKDSLVDLVEQQKKYGAEVENIWTTETETEKAELDKRAENQKNHSKTVIDINAQTAEQKAKADKKAFDEAERLAKKEVEIKKQLQQQQTQNFASTLSYISGLQSSQVKELFYIGKAGALAQATIDGIAATQKALTAAPPPWNFVLAGLVGAAAGANIASIVATPPPAFAKGGMVAGQGNSDSVHAMLTPGEVILNRAQQDNLAGQFSEPIQINLTIGDKIFSQTINRLAETGQIDLVMA